MTAESRAGSVEADPGLQLIAAGLTELLGFGAAVINILRGDELVVAAAAGTAEGRIGDREGITAEGLVGTRWPTRALHEVLEVSEVWGHFHFASRYDAANVGHEFWFVSGRRRDGEDAWHPDDVLVAPIYDDDGALRGCISVDDPLDGRRPDGARRAMLERFADEARNAVLLTLERERLARRARAHALAQAFLRNATSTLSLDEVRATLEKTLVRALDADGIRILARGPHGEYVVFGSQGFDWQPTEKAAAIGARLSADAWLRDTYSIIDRGLLLSGHGPAGARDELLGVLDRAGADAAMMVPVGVRHEPLGQMLLFRRAGRPSWTAADGRMAMELGRDLAYVVVRSNVYQRERELAEHLRRADLERGRLIDTVVSELSRPLAELAQAVDEAGRAERGSVPWRSALTRVTASADRTARTVEDLLLLSRLADPPAAGSTCTVELSQLLESICHTCMPRAVEHRVVGRLDVSAGRAYVAGDRGELETALERLIANAIAYTPAGGRLNVRLEPAGNTVVVSVADNGIGIPADEQELVFAEFARGSDPLVQRTPGAGLGLAIVRRVAERHGGRVELDSTPGVGSTFRLVLPAQRPHQLS